MCCWPLSAQSFSGTSPLGLQTIVYCLRFENSLFVASYDSQGHGGSIRPNLYTGTPSPKSKSKSKSKLCYDRRSAGSLSWNKVPIWGLRPDLDYCLTVGGLLTWGALSDERTGLPFAIATGPCQRSPESESESYVTTDGQPAGLSWNKDYDQIFVIV
jgi:hypothetical protein